MNNTNKINFKIIKKKLALHNINFDSTLDDNIIFNDFNSIERSNNNDITFFLDNSSVNLLDNINAKACLISKKKLKFLPKNINPIVVSDTYKAFTILSNLFSNSIVSNGIISDSSEIHKDTILHNNIQIDPFVNIKENCIIHNNVIIESNCVIGPNVTILKNTIIKSNCNLLFCKIGSNCIIKSGAVIGGTGFGFDPIEKIRIHHKGDVQIGNNCNIGSNTSIDRAVFDSTIINDNCFIDNLVQIAHNVQLGNGCILASQTGIAGSTILGTNVMVGGQAGISGHLIIGDNVKIAAKSGVTKNLLNNSVVAGFPARDIKKWKISNIKLNKL